MQRPRDDVIANSATIVLSCKGSTLIQVIRSIFQDVCWVKPTRCVDWYEPGPKTGRQRRPDINLRCNRHKGVIVKAFEEQRWYLIREEIFAIDSSIEIPESARHSEDGCMDKELGQNLFESTPDEIWATPDESDDSGCCAENKMSRADYEEKVRCRWDWS
ncbi:hypothetical protein Aduo_018032 [Ancylostoma duodenale]